MNKEDIGVIVKSWIGKENSHEVYVRILNEIKTFKESEIERYLVRHKFLSDEEKEYQFNVMNNL